MLIAYWYMLVNDSFFSQHSGHLAAFGWTKCQPRRMDWKFIHGAGGGWHVENNTMGGCEDENQTKKYLDRPKDSLRMIQ